MYPNITNDVLEEWMENVKEYATEGQVADYIPALSKQDPNNLAIAICQLNGQCGCAGNTDHLFTLQSISKVIALALALMDNGEEYVFSQVGMEPSGNPYNSVEKLANTDHTKPLNPMINAGALAVTHMIHGHTPSEKVGRLLSFIHDLTSDQSISYNEEIAASEFNTANLNRSLCYFMKQGGIIKGSVEELLDTYTKQCAIEMNINQLARLGALFANEGVDLDSGRQILPKNLARICKTFMVTCGKIGRAHV